MITGRTKLPIVVTISLSPFFTISALPLFTNINPLCKVVIFNGEKLESASNDKKKDFWDRLLETFSLVYLPIKGHEDIEFFWRTRVSGPSELNFEEVRRLGL